MIEEHFSQLLTATLSVRKSRSCIITYVNVRSKGTPCVPCF